MVCVLLACQLWLRYGLDTLNQGFQNFKTHCKGRCSVWQLLYNLKVMQMVLR